MTQSESDSVKFAQKYKKKCTATILVKFLLSMLIIPPNIWYQNEYMGEKEVLKYRSLYLGKAKVHELLL